MATASPDACIGVFDSGVGGLSVLRAIHQRLPSASLHYVADSAHAPYGEKSVDFIRERADRIVAHLVGQGATVIVVACNTATAVAIDELRHHWPACGFVGVEPGVRPAVAASRNRHVGVMATDATLRSERFRALVAREAGNCTMHLQACSGLAAAIEQRDFDDPVLLELVQRYAGALREADVDVVALGCTHYPFVRAAIEQSLGADIAVIDTADAVAAQVARVWRSQDGAGCRPGCRLETTGDPRRLAQFAGRCLDFDVEAADATLVL
jgi:glutamate racemase